MAAKVARIAPKCLAILGIGAYRQAFRQAQAITGLQERRFGKTAVWVLPNPSGLNAYYQVKDLVTQLRELHKAVNRKRVL